MEASNKHNRDLNIKIDRMAQLRCVQNILELNGINTDKLESIDLEDLYINIEFNTYIEEGSYYKNKAYTEIKVNPKYSLDKGSDLVSLKYIENILNNSQIIHKE